MATLKVGIIGTGRHGSRYANHIINDLPNLRLTAISRRSQQGQEQASAWKVRCYEEWRDLVNDPEVEAVIAATPPNINLAIAEACVSAKKPLLIEKPLAVNAEAATQIVDLFRSADLPLTVGQTLRFNAIVRTLRRELPKVGSLYSFSANQRLEETLHDWLDDEDIAGAGVILHTAVHVFDGLRFITGREITRVRSTMFCLHNSTLENLFTAQVEMAGDLIGTVDASKVGPSRSGRYEFVGSKGQLHGDQVHGFVEFIQQNTIEAIAREEPVSTIIPLLAAWYDHLLGKGPNPIPGEDGLAAVRICDACLQSAREDRWIHLS